jgi:hypothetical protein
MQTPLPALLGETSPAVPESPLLTYLDDATGERTELTAAELGGWAARTAGLLHEDCGLGAGSRAAVLLPPHWQTAAVLLGAWSIGIAVSFRPWATAGLAPVGLGSDLPLDVVFVSRRRLDSWLEVVPEAPHRFVLSLARANATPHDLHANAAPGDPHAVATPGVPHAVATPGDPPGFAARPGYPAAAGAGADDVPAGYRDYLTEVIRFSADLPAYGSIHSADAASPDGTTYRQWGALGKEMADRLDLRPGDRLLVDVARHEQPVMWLLAPLAAGASVVLCANLDPGAVDARVAAEGITRVL